MASLLYRIGRFCARRVWVVIGSWLAVAVAVVIVAGAVGGELEDTFEVPGLDSQTAVELLSDAESEQAGLTARLVATPTDDTVTFFDSEPARAELTRAQRAVEALPSVLATSDPAGALARGSEHAVAAGAVSVDGRTAMMTIQYPVIEDLSRDDLDQLKHAVGEMDGDALRIEMGGDLFFNFEEAGSESAELIGVLAALVILLLAFGSVIAAGLPIGIAVFGLGLGIATMALIDHVVDIPSWAPQIASMVGLGVGIDYALLLVTRHREFLARGLSVDDAAGRAVATAGQAVIFAGGTVVIAILGLAVAGVPFMTAAGIATSVTVAIMVVASVTLLPAFLGLSGQWINRLGIHRRSGIGGDVGAGWQRWGRHVTRHAWPYAVGVTLLLVALSAPAAALRLGFPDEGTLPQSRTERVAYDLVADGFGPGLNGPLVIAVDLARVEGDRGPVVELLADAVAADAGIASVGPAEIDEAAGVATIVAIPTSPPQDEATYATVQRLRSEVFPAALSGTAASAHVGGQTATFGDVADRVSQRLVWFVAAVVVLSVVLLMLVFRSVLVPLKAALLNLLSIGAAYGVLVMVFQWGWGKELIGLETTVPIVSFIPMFMFAILFGLSMDYEVFLLSRVREEYLSTGDNDASVITAIASTARVITSAALIMICVFAGFVLGSDPVVKMMGLGLAVAIFVDATVVRIVLVPASMTLLGDANWWLPGWLDRLLPTIDLDSESSLPAAEPEPEPEVGVAAAVAPFG